jgi:hypothetical protein
MFAYGMRSPVLQVFGFMAVVTVYALSLKHVSPFKRELNGYALLCDGSLLLMVRFESAHRRPAGRPDCRDRAQATTAMMSTLPSTVSPGPRASIESFCLFILIASLLTLLW